MFADAHRWAPIAYARRPSHAKGTPRRSPVTHLLLRVCCEAAKKYRGRSEQWRSRRRQVTALQHNETPTGARALEAVTWPRRPPQGASGPAAPGSMWACRSEVKRLAAAPWTAGLGTSNTRLPRLLSYRAGWSSHPHNLQQERRADRRRASHRRRHYEHLQPPPCPAPAAAPAPPLPPAAATRRRPPPRRRLRRPGQSHLGCALRPRW
mmetsp:Transcript_8180/g.27003  ORF Transcript_8180/g.27003 Transcript_8180/m.27003 type:complete len:208 (+) Transcript_8180:655-1278(+)